MKFVNTLFFLLLAGQTADAAETNVDSAALAAGIHVASNETHSCGLSKEEIKQVHYRIHISMFNQALQKCAEAGSSSLPIPLGVASYSTQMIEEMCITSSQMKYQCY